MSFKIINLRSQEASSPDDHFASTVLQGLSKKEKCLPSWLIFDDRGSEIFKEITELESYHPAVSETAILHRYKEAISDMVSPEPFQLIELGSGVGCKTLILIEHFLNKQLQFDYIPIDISAGAIENLVAFVRSKYSGTSFSVKGVVADYFQGLEKFTASKQKRNFVLYLGLTIGNQELSEANIFLTRLAKALNVGDYVMIGFDMLKHPKKLYHAYNDPQGLFEKFNLHVLDRINRQLGANFNIANFVHQGHYNWRSRAVESYIYSTKEQTVQIKALDREFHFEYGEGMQTEHSYKFTLAEIVELAEENGFEIVKHLFDADKNFVDSIWKVK
jgi:dimethylhistidine N-methyltransferase